MHSAFIIFLVLLSFSSNAVHSVRFGNIKSKRLDFFLNVRKSEAAAIDGKKLEKLQQLSTIRGGQIGQANTIDSGSIFAEKENVNSVGEVEKGRIFWFDVMYPIIKSALSNIVTDTDVLHVLSRILSVVAWLYIVLSTLGTWGFDTKPVVSLLGIGGLTVGFSAQGLLADSYAGLFLLFSRPFQRGDVITINGLKGKVLSVDMRYVRLYSVAEKSEILIPVSTVYKSEIKIDRSFPNV